MSEHDEAVAEALAGVMEAPVAAEAPPEAVTAPVTPVPTPEAPPVAKSTVDASRALAARAAKEREFRQMEAAVKKERTELEAFRKEVEESKELARLAKEDPMEFLSRTGHSFEKMGADLMTGKRPGPGDEALKQIAALTAKLAERDAEDMRRKVETQYDSTKQDIFKYLGEKAAEYDLVNAAGAFEDVFDEVQRHYEDTGEIDVDGAAQRVEAQLESMSEKLVKSQKVRKFFPSDATAPPQQSRTLTNQTAVITSRDKAPISDEERFAAAIAHLGN